MIFLTLLYVCFFSGPWNTLALPTDFRPPENFTRNHLQSIFIRQEETKCVNTRSIYSILWSCFATIFACTWIVAHTNIPAPRDSHWAILGRWVAIMGYLLVAPEFVILLAARQHSTACHLTKKHEKNHTGWTRVHAFFLIMGGFTLHEEGKPVRVLEAEELEDLSEAGKIEWPTVTEEEITDRSKGDYLSKTLVFLQTTWFTIQCIARGVYGLPLTELEAVTIAFASLTGVTYYFWWDKPLDVHCSIPVHLLPGRLRQKEEVIGKEDTDSQIIPPESSDQDIRKGDEKVVVIPNPLPSIPIQVDTTTLGSHIISVPEVSDPSTSIQVNTSTPDPPLTSTGSYVISLPEVSDPSTSVQGETSTPDPALNPIQQFRAFRRAACEEYGILIGFAYAFIGFPLKRFFLGLFDMINCTTLGDKRLRVPTFYSPDDEAALPFAIAACVATVFGAIHCIAWSFHFPTLRDQWVWRISAILIVGLPTSTLVFGGLLVAIEGKKKTPGIALLDAVGAVIMVAMVCLYIIARIVLLVLPLVTLYSLQPGVYVQFNWADIIPHV
jgi:hypothetical protein